MKNKHLSSVVLLLGCLFLFGCADADQFVSDSERNCNYRYSSKPELKSICYSGVEIGREQIFKTSCKENAFQCYTNALEFCGANSMQDLRNPQIKACTDGVDFMSQEVMQNVVWRYMFVAERRLPNRPGEVLPERTPIDHIIIDGRRIEVIEVELVYTDELPSHGTRK